MISLQRRHQPDARSAADGELGHRAVDTQNIDLSVGATLLGYATDRRACADNDAGVAVDEIPESAANPIAESLIVETMYPCAFEQVGANGMHLQAGRIETADEGAKRLDVTLSGVKEADRRHAPRIA